MDVLLKYNNFYARDEIYPQTNVMGNSLSPIVTNIFCRLIEKNIKAPKFKSDIIFYVRYFVDVLCIMDKNKVNNLLSEMMSFDPGLNFK